jgi:hypothetical protein
MIMNHPFDPGGDPPAQSTVTDLTQFSAAANTVARLMAAAVTRLAELRRERKL